MGQIGGLRQGGGDVGSVGVTKPRAVSRADYRLASARSGFACPELRRVPLRWCVVYRHLDSAQNRRGAAPASTGIELQKLESGGDIFRDHASLAFLDEEARACLHIRWECPLSAKEVLFPADFVG